MKHKCVFNHVAPNEWYETFYFIRHAPFFYDNIEHSLQALLPTISNAKTSYTINLMNKTGTKTDQNGKKEINMVIINSFKNW